MKTFILAAALLLPSVASAQITMYRPNYYGSHLYQFGPRGTSITTTINSGYGGFNQYHYGPGRSPQFVQPLPTYNYAPPVYYQPAPVYRPWGMGYGMGSW